MPLSTLSDLYLPAIEAELRHSIGSEAVHWREATIGRGLAAEESAGPEDTLSEYYAMLEHHLGWSDGTHGGKRIRPLLLLLCCTAAGGDWRQALPLAAAVELVHNFSLIHDDIQDSSLLRRGRPTVWARWGQAQAINAGDAMFTVAHLAPQRLLALGVPAATVLAALAELDYTCLALTQGQHLDMAFERRVTVSPDEYLAMIDRKTAALIAAAAHLGASIPGSDRINHYREYGRNLGLAFQLQDDLLGIWGDPAVTGKSAATDIEKRKKSLPVVYGLEHSADFAAAYAQPHGESLPVEALTHALEELGARSYVEDCVKETTARARASLELMEPAAPAGDALRQLTDSLLGRAL